MNFIDSLDSLSFCVLFDVLGDPQRCLGHRFSPKSALSPPCARANYPIGGVTEDSANGVARKVVL